MCIRDRNNTLRTQMQMIFQDPMASLNPRKKVEDIIGEGLDIHHMYLSLIHISWAMTQPMAGCPTSVPTWWRWCWAR